MTLYKVKVLVEPAPETMAKSKDYVKNFTFDIKTDSDDTLEFTNALMDKILNCQQKPINAFEVKRILRIAEIEVEVIEECEPNAK